MMKRRLLASTPRPRPRFAWTLTTIVVGTGFFLAALNNDFYQLTSPIELSWHVTLRKVFSVGAFAVVAFLMRKTLTERGIVAKPIPIVVSGALFSAAIEVGQYVNGGTEGLGWNAADVACGALGGAVAAIDLLIKKRAPKTRSTTVLSRRRGNLRK